MAENLVYQKIKQISIFTSRYIVEFEIGFSLEHLLSPFLNTYSGPFSNATLKPRL
jgi:hypothetical protein